MRRKKATFLLSILFTLFFATGLLLPIWVKNNSELIESKLSEELSSKIQLNEIGIKWTLQGPSLRFYDFSFLNEGLHFKQVDVGLDVIRSVLKRDVILSFFSLKGFKYEMSLSDVQDQTQSNTTKNTNMKEVIEKISKMTTDILISDVSLTIKKSKGEIKFSNIKTKIIPGISGIDCSLSFVLNDRIFLNGHIDLLQDEMALSSKNYSFEGRDFSLKGHFRIPASDEEEQVKQVYIYFKNTYFHKLLQEASAMFPESQMIRQMKEIVVKGSLERGYLNIVKRSAQDNYDITGEFEIDKLDINFSPDWPQLQEIKTNLKIKNDSATATIHQGHTQGVGIQRAVVIGTKLYGEQANLDVRSLLAFQGKYASEYLQHSPVWDELSFVGGMVNLKKSFEAQIALDIPIFHAKKTRLVGTLLFKPDSLISFYDSNYELSHLDGGVTFNEKGLTRSKITGFLFQDEFILTADQKKMEFFSYPLAMTYLVGKGENTINIEKAILPEYITKSRLQNRPVKKLVFPPLRVNAKYIDYNGKVFRNVGATRLPIEKGFVWEKVSAFGDEFSLRDCELTWLSDIEYNSNAICKIEVHNFGMGINKIGLSDSVEKGDGHIEYRSQWRGDISEFDVMGVTSNIKIDVKDLKMKAQKSRLRQFLNYLTFNIFENDSKAIKIDKLQGEVTQNKQVFSTKNFVATTAAMDMNATGSYNTSDKNVNLDVVLSLNLTGLMKTYGLYSAVALANPAVFALAWIPGLRELSKHTIGKLFEQEYNVTGSVDTPVVKVTKFANIPIPGFQKK